MTLQSIINLLQHYKYIIIFPLAIIEGPILMVLCGLLLKLRYLSFWPLYASLVTGDLLGDYIWYAIGHHGAKKLIERFGHLASLDNKIVQKIGKIFHKYKNSALLVSKMTMGFGFALITLLTAGMVKIPVKNFLIMNFIGGVFWTGLLLMLGYVFGNIYVNIDSSFKAISLIAMAIVLLGLLYGFGRYFKQTVLKNKI